MSDPSARTEPATPRALRRARERGDVPRSRVASLAFAWVGVSLGLAVGLEAGIERLAAFARRSFSLAWLSDGVPLMTAAGEAAQTGAGLVLFPVVGAVSVGAVGAVAVLGRVVLRPVHVDVARLAPSRNLRWLSETRPSPLGARSGGLLAALLLTAALVDLFLDAAPGLFARLETSPARLGPWLSPLLPALLLRMSVALAALGAVAGVWARVRWRRSQRMTRREMRQEQREDEGDPTAKQRRRARHRALSDAPTRAALLEDAALLVRGEGITVVLAWVRREAAPTVQAVVTGPAAAQLVLAAPSLPRTLDPGLALELARVARGNEVPARLWARITRPLARAERAPAASEGP